MPKISTPNKIVQFIYNECTLEESIQISEKIRSSAKVENIFSQMANSLLELTALKLNPSKRTINKIMEHC